jgi:uncharacterized membrane protein
VSVVYLSLAKSLKWKRRGVWITLWTLSLILWVGLLIATPISLWLAGRDVFPIMATLGVLAQAGATLLALAGGWPSPRIGWALLVVLVGTWGIEFLGSTTGFPFGDYAYTDALQPQLAGVPLLIPLAWLMMLGPAWAMAEAILAGAEDRLAGWYGLVHALLTGAAFTVWDLYLDPQMVANGLWGWDQPGGYFGIPWLNYLGWWLSASLLTLVIRPARLPRRPLMVIYTLTWAFQAIGLGLFWRQPGPALTGLVGMGAFVAWAWSREVGP